MAVGEICFCHDPYAGILIGVNLISWKGGRYGHSKNTRAV